MKGSVIIITGDVDAGVIQQLSLQFPDLKFVTELPQEPCIRKSTTHDERFLHFKEDYFAECVECAGYSSPKAATAFSRKEGDNWYVAFALTHPNDQFSRSMGRKIARRHYFSGAKVLLGTEYSYELVENKLWEKLDG